MMSEKIYLKPEDAWVFFCKNKARLEKEMVEVARSSCGEYTIYLTMDEALNPKFLVYEYGNDEDPVYEEWCVNETDTENTALRVYKRYLYLDLDDGEDGGEEDIYQARDDEIYQREDALRLAMLDFLACALQERSGDDVVKTQGESFVAETLDYILEYISLDHGIPIYRPMFVDDPETGEEVFEEFPYFCPADNGDDELPY